MSSSKHNFTQRDIEVLAAAFQSLKTPADIDYEKLAAKAGYKNATSARVCFRDIKKKIDAMSGDGSGKGGGDDTPTTTSTKKRTAKSKTTTSTANSDDEETPLKKKAKTAAKVAKAVRGTVKNEVEWPTGVNVDEGEDTGIGAYDLVEREVLGIKKEIVDDEI